MTTPPPDQQPTRVLAQETAEQPVVTAAPATRLDRIWSHVPARVGRARTSTLVIGCLFVLLMALNTALPQTGSGTTPVTTPDGRVVEIPSSFVPSGPTTPAPATTAPGSTRVPATTSAPASTSGAPQTTADVSGSTPSETTRAPSRSLSTAPPSSGPASATNRAPSSTAGASESTAPSTISSAPSS